MMILLSQPQAMATAIKLISLLLLGVVLVVVMEQPVGAEQAVTVHHLARQVVVELHNLKLRLPHKLTELMLVLVVLQLAEQLQAEIAELHQLLILFQQLVVVVVVFQVIPVVAAEVVTEETILLVVQERLMKDLLVEQQDQALLVGKTQVAVAVVRVKSDKQEIVATMPATAETDLPTYFVQAQMKLEQVAEVVEFERMFLAEI
jgi:hypothetical protein